MPTFSHLYSSALDQELGSSDSTRLFLTQRRKDAINRGVLEFADLTECFLRQTTVVTSAATAEYNLFSTVNLPGGDYLRLAKVKPEYRLYNSTAATPVSTTLQTVVSGNNFERRDLDWLNQYEPGWQLSTGGTPRYYYERVDGGVRALGLYPPPSYNSSQSGFVVLPYVAQPPTLTSDTDVPFSLASTSAGPSTGIRTDLVPYHQAAVHYAAYQLEKLRINEEGSQRQLQIFLGYVQRFLQASQAKGGRTVKVARSYFREASQRRRESRGPLDMTIARQY